MYEENNVHQGDCLDLFRSVNDGQVDLVFADPPFNIGYRYDVYQDRRQAAEYIDWCRRWIGEIRRVLKPHGSFWLAIGDEFAAELKLVAQNDAGFVCRSWVIWYYTFGVNCVRGFSRSHTHLFHFVADANHFVFNGENPAVRVPSARQLVYADSRANAKGRLPDNTWIYRPQDAPPGSFAPEHDTWYFARVAGTFKEREGFHGCQMPEQLLGRIIRISSNPRDLVLDPFSGSGTTLVVAKKLGRQWLGFELSPDYVGRIRKRLEQAHVNAPLDGPADPLASAPKTKHGRSKGTIRNGRVVAKLDEETQDGVLVAYRRTSGNESPEIVLCDPDLNRAFIDACKSSGLAGNAAAWNQSLLHLQKSGVISPIDSRKPRPTFTEMDPYSFASEIAMQTLAVDYQLSITEVLCEPTFASAFDRVAAEFAPAYSPFAYRWAALSIRKRSAMSRRLATSRFQNWQIADLPPSVPIAKFPQLANEVSGVYVLRDEADRVLYVGESRNVVGRVRQLEQAVPWTQLHVATIQFIPVNGGRQHGLQSRVLSETSSLLNSDLLRIQPSRLSPT